VTGSKLGTSIAMAVLFAGAAIGHAQQAQQPQAATSAAMSSSSAAAAKATTGAASATKSSVNTGASDSGPSEAQLKEARDDGFKPVTRGSATLYCKSEILVGSSFPMHICYNADRLKIVMQQQEAERMQLQQMHGGGLQTH
jgi:hypothetical protein